ncbi:MAG TPA: hypothetical protein VJZ26_01555, partial [Blastocatellia bacterium]|nr:hypothetical protein [Blastocatellia bacterium]
MTEMAWACIIRSSDRELFKRCRRAWDFSSRSRQNYEPVKPERVFDFDRAIRDALAVYYFPGMWEWNREIVLPLALEGFFKSMRNQREKYVELSKPSAEDERDWNYHIELGEAMLERYFKLAPTIDRFSPIRVETEFEVNIPDPLQPGEDLVAQEGVPLRYRGRINLLVVDGNDAYWLVKHKIVGDEWDDLDRMLLDQQSVSYCWAWENFFIGMKIAGTIYNEIRKDVSRPPARSTDESRHLANNRNTGHRRMYAQPA